MTDQREYPDPPTEVEAMSPAALTRTLDAGEPLRVLDVRDRDEIEQWAIDGPAVTRTAIPYAKFMQAQVRDTVADLATGIDGEGPITVVCGRGEASDYVAGLLAEAGVEARNLAGGMNAWARIYEAREVGTDPVVVQYARPSSGCLAYMIVSDGAAAVVDPLRAFTDRYVADATDRGADIVAVLDTHVHADHVSGLRDLAAETGARAVMPAPAAERGVSFEVETVAPGDALTVGSASVEAVALPGHTTGMTGYRAGNVLLSGDSVFLDGIARPDLQEGGDLAAMARELYATLTERLAAVDDDTAVAPGHYDEATEPAADGSYAATLGEIRARLGALDDEAAFVERVTDGLPPEPANAERIVAINLGRAEVDAETAFELELGPNNCAA
jgi:glyoxylase-like metal-dependent hydrolase (beta-lactamase superfamily II)